MGGRRLEAGEFSTLDLPEETSKSYLGEIPQEAEKRW
jgi:hypothetical protein